MSYDPISAKIKSVLQSVTLSGNAVFVSVNEYPTSSFSGYPSALVLPANSQPGDFATVRENVRFYTFDVLVYYQAESDQDTDWRNMRQLVDVTMDAIDRTIDLGGLCDFLRPTYVQWGVDQTATGTTLIATISVICQSTVQLS